MTCQECQPLAIDLARGLPPFDVGAAVQRGDVLSHIARCRHCAQWLAEQEALTEALRAAARADASLSAPASVEANVMAAWRARQVREVPQAVQARQVPQTRQPREPGEARDMRQWRKWPTAGLAAAAAVVILALSLSALRWLNAPPSVQAEVQAGGQTRRQAGEPTRAPVTGTHAAVVEVLPEKGSKGRGRPVPPRGVPPRPAQAQSVARNVAGSVDAAARSGGAARTARTASATRTASTARNRATRGASELGGPAFVLLPYVEPLRPTEMRHIMRVRMSRALVAAGDVQTGNAEGATVLADVLVGEDGTARAVRIVQ
jgi:hypothetical protein